MYAWYERLGTLAIAAAVLFAALRAHKSSRRSSKWAGVVLAFLAGCAFLVTFVGSWMGELAATIGGAFFVAGLIVCAAIIFYDLWDKRPDKGVFWAAFALAAMSVFGIASIPTATSQVGNGVTQVGNQVGQIGGGGPAPVNPAPGGGVRPVGNQGSR